MSPHPHWQGDPQGEQPDKQHDEQNQRSEIPLEVRRPDNHWHGSPWHDPHWQGFHGQQAWTAHTRGAHRWQRTPQRRRMFARMAGGLLFIVLLGAGAMALASHIFSDAAATNEHTRYFFFLRFCGLALLVPFVIMFIGSRMYRAYALPLADIMDAAEAVATGDLQVRVSERGSREFQRLASSFNRMTGELERIDQQRRNLTADVAHELRTPLHIIQGNLEGILDGVYAPTPEHIEATLQETRTLARLVDDLRTLSLAESGQLPLHPEAVDVHDLLADVATSFSPQAESAGIELCVEADERVPMTLYGDPGRLDQVLSNLVNNALRHTPTNGRITLGATLLQNGDLPEGKVGRVQLTVADTGEGIPADDLPFIFDRFWRGDRARTHKEGTGSGLGLAITGQLVKAHGGSITVASTPGSGTIFTLTLPVSPQSAKIL